MTDIYPFINFIKIYYIENLNGYQNRMRNLIFITVAFFGMSLSAHATVFFTFTGGTGGTPLTATISASTASFTSTESHSGPLFIVFRNVYNNTATSTSSGTSSTAILAGSAFNGTSGSIDNSLVDTQDLILGTLAVNVIGGVPFEITPGSITTGSLNFNYTDLNPSGSIIFLQAAGNQLDGASGSYIVTSVPVPEPSNLMLSLLAISSLCLKRKRK